MKSKRRVAGYGEVFTPPWLVADMLNLVHDEVDRIDSRFLEPACGSGNFLVPVLRRKISIAKYRYRRSEFNIKHYSLLGLMCLYGVEILTDNTEECRERLISVFAQTLELTNSDDMYLAAQHIVSRNIVNADALTMKTVDGNPIVLAEWGYLGLGKYQRRDFLLDKLAETSNLRINGTLFANARSGEVFSPIRTYPSMTVSDLADCHRTSLNKAE